MNGCVYEKDGKCMKFTTDIVTSYCYGNGYPCEDRAITNGMKIRAMTDEELADWLYIWAGGAPSCDRDINVKPDDKTCRDCWLDWLKQEVE